MHASMSAARCGTVRWLSESLFQLSGWLGHRSSALAVLVKQLNHLLTGLDAAWDASVGTGLAIPHPTGVVIGKGVTLGDDCVIQSCVTIGGGRAGDDRQPVIGSRVLVGAGARVLGPIEVGDDVTIGANSVVIASVPANSTVVGVPARILGGSTAPDD
jgi:serine O-acetyltransferase